MIWSDWKHFSFGFDLYADTDPGGYTHNMLTFQVWPLWWRFGYKKYAMGGCIAVGPLRFGWQYS